MDTTKTLIRLYNDYTKVFLKKILIAFAFSFIIAASISSIAWLLDPAIKKIFIDKDQTLIFLIPLAIIVAFASKGLSIYFAKTIMIRVGEDVRKSIQMDMLEALINADTDYIDNHHTGGFIARLTNDVTMIVNMVSTALLNLFKDSITLIGLLSVMFYQNWKLSLISIIMIPLASFAARSLGKRVAKVTTENMQLAESLTKFLVELFKNHKLTKTFQNEQYENIRANKFFYELKEKTIKLASIFVRATPIMEVLTGIMIAVLIYASGKLIVSGEIEVNNFFSFLAAMMLAYQPVRSLATLNISLNQGLSAAKRILPIIDIKNKVGKNENNLPLKIANGNIEFKNVSFKYELDEEVGFTKAKIETKNNVLNNINLKVESGKMTSLVGHSGAGKSTILNLIPRFYNPNSGQIFIDEQSIQEVNLSTLRKHISLVSQDTTLFDDTIRNNILYANLNATEEEVHEAAKLSFALDFIEKLPNKFNTMIGENGVRLSGGEKQRLSIARAMLKKSQIILLDEATSSLDAETEDKIQNAINYLTKNRTTLVIAHRLSTILNSDKIYVIDNGLVVGEGKHEELLINSKIYENFYRKQIKKN
jgi:subfamily B ATP-binding cassette protein MsbA